MRSFTTSLAGPLSGDVARQVKLLLLLSAALVGFFLLLEFVVSLASAGPRDILAVSPSQEKRFGVPNGVDLLRFLAFAVSIVLASAVLLASLGWPLRRLSLRPTWTLAIGLLVAAALVAAGAYLAFSEVLGSAVAYDEHQVQRFYLESGGLLLLGTFFLSLTIAGILNWRLLVVSLVLWLAAAGVFGFLDTEPIDGLLLFPRTSFLEVPASFAEAVSGLRQTDGTSSGQSGGEAAAATGTLADTSLQAEVTALQLPPPEDAPVFRVAGAVHTRYLRTSTGDSYSDGTWGRSDTVGIALEKDVPVLEVLGPLTQELHLPTATPLHEFTDRIVVTPVEGRDGFPASILPVSKNLRSVDTPATYYPASEILAVDSGVSGYQWESALPLFALLHKVGAAPVADPAYLQLPDELPPRIHELARQVGTAESPYLRARQLQVYLQEEYVFRAATTGEEAQPPPGRDPVDWFLFDSRVGTSGNFSSAFVVLARAAGIPARAVSGWVVARQEDIQTVHRNQTHQWAEVALDWLGWVTVDPIPRDAFTDADVDHGFEVAVEEMATSADPDVREAMAGLWNDANNPEALFLLFQAIDNAPDIDAREAARTTLGTLALDRFIGMLLEHEDPLMRAAAAYGLEVLANPEALDALLQALATDEDARVRAAAADALAVLGKDRAEEPLLQALQTDEDAVVREAVARALGTLKAPWTAGRMVPALRSDPAPGVRAEVALALGEIRESVALRPLLDARSDDASAEVRAAADEALANWDYPDLLEVLESAEDPVQRAAAAQLIGERRYPAASSEMAPILSSDPASLVRAAVALALGEIRNNEALRPLLYARLHDESADVRAAADEALHEWDFDALLSILETAVDPLQRAAAAQLMGERKYSHTRALQALLRALATDESAHVREQVALALGEIGDSMALRPLLDARSDDASAAVRNAAAEALAGWDLSALLSTLESAADPAQRAAAAQLMGERQYTGAIPALTRALADPAQEVRDAAREALERLGASTTGLEGNGAGTGGSGDGTGTGGAGDGDGTGGVLSAEDLAALARADEATRDAALETLEGQGAEVFRLENGGALVTQADDAFFTFGTTTSQATELPHIPVFNVTGTVRTGYLRVSVGDVYEDGGWRQLDPVGIPYTAGSGVSEEIWEQYTAPAGGFSTLPPERRTSESLFGFRDNASHVTSNRIQVVAAGSLEELPRGVMPTSLDVQQVTLDGVFHPFSATFVSENSVVSYSWTSNVSSFSRGRYLAATAVADETYTQLPPDLPDRVRELAQQITAPHDSPYAKAKALEQYLKTRYTYGFAESGSTGPPAGQDPVDWFLFDTRKGTCGQFSSAFAVLARSVGIPTRVVSGWMVSAAPGRQTVYTDQAHQRAEIALEGIGWVWFEPTASGGAPSRIQGAGDGSGDNTAPAGPADTVTNITVWPAEIRRGTPFIVGGTVLTTSGLSVSGVTVEVYINETKEHGGTKIGTTTTRAGRFQVEVQLAPDMELGGYQLLARAVANERYNESWSDPDIKVFSGNRLELAGPAEVVLNTRATFTGRVMEDNGQGSPGRSLNVTIDGNTAPAVTTDSAGRFTFSDSFSRLGQHWVEVQIRGEEFLLDNTARLDFQVVLPTEVEAYAPVAVEIGEEFVVGGELRGADGSALAAKRIGVRVGRGSEQSVSTDTEGRFEVVGTVPSAGEFTVTARFRGEGSVLASSGTTRFQALHAVTLTLEGPLRLERGDGAVFQGRLASDTFAPTGQVELTVGNGSDGQVVTVDLAEDGTFEYQHPSFGSIGPHTLTARFAGAELVQPASAEFAFEVLEPTVLTLDGPAIVRDGDGFRLAGVLRESSGSPVSGVGVQVVSGEPLSLTTGAEGAFTWDAQAVFDESAAHDPHESTLSIDVVFEGTDLLAPSSATLDVPVGLSRIVVEPLEPVARGGEAVLRGTVLLGTYPVPGAGLTAGPGVAFESSSVGTFTHPYPVSGDEPLGATEVVLSAPDLGTSVTMPLVVKSAANLIVTPVGRVRPGGMTLLQVALLDDTGAGIPQAALRSSQGVDAVTDEAGIATLELTVPDSEALKGGAVVFTYTGDDLRTPLTVPYFWEGAITPAGFNWLLWVGAPGLLALAGAAAVAGRRFRVMPLPSLPRRRSAAAVPVLVPDTPGEGGEDEEDAGLEPQPVDLRIEFRRETPDLAEVWGAGEEATITISVTDEEGAAITGAIVDVSVAGDAPSGFALLDSDGAHTFGWSSEEPGDYPVSVEFAGDDDYLPASETRILRIVDFRDEIVRLYNVFLGWAKEQAEEVTEQSTPREVEALLVSRGLSIPQKALDELISRFEEADYSEHPIGRRHYEAMYRAWSAVLGPER